MANENFFEVIIIGGSYAGLSAAMALGRSLRRVLIIDSGKPCNRQTPHSHNFILHDGYTPAAIAEKARSQVLAYDTVKWVSGWVTDSAKSEQGYLVQTESGEEFSARKLIFATGVTDKMPAIPGFAECWGISVLHCPYCHGYEVRNEPLGVLGNGDMGFEFSRLIHHWTHKLSLFTNGPSTLSEEQTAKLRSKGISIVEEELEAINHHQGILEHLRFKNGDIQKLSALFARVAFEQHCTLPEKLGCVINEQGFLQVDDFGKTNVPGVFAAGDNTTGMRAVSVAVAAGTKAASFLNKELIEEDF